MPDVWPDVFDYLFIVLTAVGVVVLLRHPFLQQVQLWSTVFIAAGAIAAWLEFRLLKYWWPCYFFFVDSVILALAVLAIGLRLMFEGLF